MHRGVYVSYNFYYFVTKYQVKFSDFLTGKVGYRLNKCYYYSQNMLHVYEISYQPANTSNVRNGIGSFQQDTFHRLEEIGQR